MKSKLKYIYILSALIYFTQGIKSLPFQPLFYYFKQNLHLSASTIMYIMSITSLPWIIKPVYGFISDNYRLFGYRRKSYIILSCVLCIVFCLLIGVIPVLSLFLLITFLTLDSITGAMRDVAIDGIMVEEGKKYNLTGRIQSIQWGFLTVATALTGIGGGYIASRFDYHLAFLLILIFPLLIALFAFKYKEPKRKLVKVKNPFKDFFKVFKNKQFVISTIFLFCLWFTPAIGTPIMFQLRDKLHLSKLFIGFLSTLASVFGIIGAIIYFNVSKKINLKKWLYIGVVISAISTLAYLFLSKNLVIIYSIVFGISGMFVQLLLMDFMARTCPKGTEATIFALLCSVVNLGAFLSAIVGGKLYSIVGYNGLVIISGMFTLFCLGFIPYLKIIGEQNGYKR